MTWNDLTVFQYQQIAALLEEKGISEIDLMIKSCCIVHDLTERHIDSLPLDDYYKLCDDIAFLSTDVPVPTPQDIIEVGGRRYKCMYDVRKIKAARYIEAKVFQQNGVVSGLHKVAASLVHPMKENGELAEYDAALHSDYANDMLAAPFLAVYGSVVFFCQVFRNSIKDLRAYLSLEMQKTGKSQNEIAEILENLCNAMDGSIKLPSLPSMKG